MYQLNQTERKVRQFLIDRSRQPSNETISYQQLSDACGLNLSLSNGPNADQQRINEILGNISLYEHLNEREFLSALVVSINKGIQGKGFFKLCERLGIRQQEEALYPMLKDDRRFGVAMIHKSRKFWQDEDNYQAYYSLPDFEEETLAVA